LHPPPVDLLDATGNPAGYELSGEMQSPNPVEVRVYFSFSQGKINLQFGVGGPIERVLVSGPTEVQVCIDPSGLAADLNGNGLDEVPTVMTLLQLTGNSSHGPVSISLDPSTPTTGVIEEKVNNTPGVLDLPPFTA